jgi:hypothetical protein
MDNLLIILGIIIIIALIIYAIKYYHINITMREKFITTGWINLGNDRRITVAQYHDMANAPFIANSPWSVGQVLTNDINNTIAKVPIELEARKKMAMAKMNECYEIGLENDAVNAIQMHPGSLPVLP